MKLKPGGREGGEIIFLIGLVLACLGLWFFFDSVIMRSDSQGGMISNAMRGRGGGGGGGQGGRMSNTTSMGIIFVPLFIGIVALFFDVRKTWAWGVTIIGLAILVIEIVSRLRFDFAGKTSSGILMLVMIAGGFGMMLRGYIADKNKKAQAEE
ncbi:hypothetical protein OAL00_01255 [Verrucomicrobiales bacterium]|nr:hypothetical protein [Verrucomicrobiales bacterium]